MEGKRFDPTALVAGEKDCVEEMFALLQEESGIKPKNSDDVRHNRLDKLLDSDASNPKIGCVRVDVQLVRERDKKLPHRVELANQVSSLVSKRLLEHTFPGGKLQLFVRVLLVSDGSSSASRRFTSGVGDAKVTLAYCLLTDEATEEVALAATVYHTKDCRSFDLDNYWELSSAAVRSLADTAARHIISQITFHLQQWKAHFQENQELLKKIETKLAEEAYLEAEEYTFAAAKHIL